MFLYCYPSCPANAMQIGKLGSDGRNTASILVLPCKSSNSGSQKRNTTWSTTQHIWTQGFYNLSFKIHSNLFELFLQNRASTTIGAHFFVDCLHQGCIFHLLPRLPELPRLCYTNGLGSLSRPSSQQRNTALLARKDSSTTV